MVKLFSNNNYNKNGTFLFKIIQWTGNHKKSWRMTINVKFIEAYFLTRSKVIHT